MARNRDTEMKWLRTSRSTRYAVLFAKRFHLALTCMHDFFQTINTVDPQVSEHLWNQKSLLYEVSAFWKFKL